MIRYWKVFQELIWASFKALLIVLLIIMIVLSFNFSQNVNENLFEVIIEFISFMILGVVFAFPAIALFIFIIGTPIVYSLLKNGYNQRTLLIIINGIISFLFYKLLNISLLNASSSNEVLSYMEIYSLIGGGFTGFFLYQQISKISKFK